MVLLWVCCVLPAAAAQQAQHTLLVMGDSLSAAYGIAVDDGWVSLLEQRLAAQYPNWRVVNASISGETSAGGLARLPHTLKTQAPDLVLLELGANDGLRGIPVATTQQNLAAMVEQSRAAGARVLLLGIYLPPNYGPDYTERFKAMYADLAQRCDLPLVPFLLDGVALKPEWMQGDGLHPNARGEPRVLDNVWATLEPMLRAFDKP